MTAKSAGVNTGHGVLSLTVNGRSVEAKKGYTILEAAVSAGINIPTLCYFKELNEIGACRICVVEVEGYDRLVAACNTVAEDGMVIRTSSPRVREARRMNVQLILSEHDSDCPVCPRNNNCSLQSIANDIGVFSRPYAHHVPKNTWNRNLPLIREESKCIKCMRCIQVCDKVQSLDVWDVIGTGARTTVGVADGGTLDDAGCSLCGQCATHCPVGALHERNDVGRVYSALEDPSIVTVVQVAPAVRAGWGEPYGLNMGEQSSVRKMVGSLRQIGFDYIFDTDFAADLTIMEEGSELIERLTHRDEYRWPMFTSCCPGWVRFVKHEYPQFTDNLSTAKSPQQMFGSVSKSYFAEKLGISPSKVFCVSFMPCTAKKHECAIPLFKDSAGRPDVDVVLTTREMDRMLSENFVDARNAPEEEFDSPLGEGTGAAVIFGTQAGVMEAALRSAFFLVVGENPDVDAFSSIRVHDKGWVESSFDIKDTTLSVAVASGLQNTRSLLKHIEESSCHYDFVEIMACPGGCAGGGGQPIHDGKELAFARGANLRLLDESSCVRFSHENASVQKLYEEYIGKPLSEKAHHLLHTHHGGWDFGSLTYLNSYPEDSIGP
ncbi:MAG: [FeFe] hydrogenase, group A [Clostridiales Family XIII bacterium]|jgi:NADH-quinone oxidoreductase subunit G|nr:[FeFe] hydrogenase, group A [Clostridiales Family XIII bacterium]